MRRSVFPADWLHRKDCHLQLSVEMSGTFGYSAIPAFGQILLRQRFHLRTVIVTAAVYRGFDQELRLAADPIN
jgi:hypothetical protein